MLTDLQVLNDKQPLKFAISICFTGIFRYVAHVISGVFAFGAYAMDEGATSFLTFSAVYNSYVFVDIALVVVAGILLFASKTFRKELDKLKTNAK
jgi:thiamine transporter ThiT